MEITHALLPPMGDITWMLFEQRTEIREHVVLPVNLSGGGRGLTRDVSASGLFIETDSEQEPGSMMDFEITLPSHGIPLRLVAQAQVVRVEPRGNRYGVAVRLLSSCLKPGVQ